MVNDILLYDRSAIASGEWWRLISGHFIHLSTEHLLTNSVGFFLLVYLSLRYARGKEIAILFIMSTVLISISLYVFSPDVARYGGLSGILHAIIGWIGVRMIVAGEQGGGIFVLLLISFKLLYESFYGSLFQYETFSVIMEAHLYGFAWGVALSLLKSYHDKKSKENR